MTIAKREERESEMNLNQQLSGTKCFGRTKNTENLFACRFLKQVFFFFPLFIILKHAETWPIFNENVSSCPQPLEEKKKFVSLVYQRRTKGDAYQAYTCTRLPLLQKIPNHIIMTIIFLCFEWFFRKKRRKKGSFNVGEVKREERMISFVCS